MQRSWTTLLNHHPHLPGALACALALLLAHLLAPARAPAFALPLPSAAGLVEERSPAGDARRFGSAVLLHGLWSEEQLAGEPGEKRLGPVHEPDRTPPERTVPAELPPLPERLRDSIRSVEPLPGLRPVALTFDLCERAHRTYGYDYEIVEFLRANRIRATFFAGGKWMRTHPERAMQLMADPLFELGNHSWSHRNLHVHPSEVVRREIAWTQAQYELLRDELVRRAGAAGLDAEMAAVPPHMRLMRLPFGRCDERVLSMLARMGLVTLQWNVAAEGAPEELTIPQVVQRVAGQVKPGSVMLLHANGVIDQTSELLPPLVEELRRRGYAFVTGSELLTMGEPFAVPYCYSVTPGDNMIYDRLFPD